MADQRENQDMIVRIRGTFIDIADADTVTHEGHHKDRSSSVPVRRAPRDLEETPQGPTDLEYLASWFEKANQLSPSPSRQVSWSYSWEDGYTDRKQAQMEVESTEAAESESCSSEAKSTPAATTGSQNESENETVAERKPSEEESEVKPITTMMICDIPCRKTTAQVLEAIDSFGFAGTYDLIYMPPQKGFRRANHSQNMGYAFINFKTPEWAAEFCKVFQNYSFPNSCSTKLTYAKAAHRQGYQDTMELHAKQRVSGCLLTFP